MRAIFPQTTIFFFFGVLFFPIVAIFAQENHLRNIQKLTFGGDNAEAYFSPNGQQLTLQVTNPAIGAACDQIYRLDLRNKTFSPKSLQLVSTGKGRTTCSYFMPDGKQILYASTHAAADACPEAPKHRADGKYLWAIYPEFDIYVADEKGKIMRQLTNSPGYDAEAVVSPDGKKIAFTSIRSGDLELWAMDIDGSNLHQVTNGLGYDGGCFFSHDSKKLVFRASRPQTAEDIAEYKSLLQENLVAPTQMEIYTCNVDGSNMKQITHLGKANWAPFFHPSDSKIIFSSNHHAKKGYDFQLYLIDTTGNNLQQVTYESQFNAFPMFSPDGKKLVFSSNRQQEAPRETNVFIADWVETDPAEQCQAEQLKQYVNYLASDELEGRLSGSPAEKKAATYLAQQFQQLGLKPYSGKDFLQPFTYNWNPNPHDTTASKVAVAAHNVVAYLDNKANKTIVIGAHYDHLGRNEHNNSTQANSKGQIHNGADDNASGVAGVLELARMFSKNTSKEPVNIIFACFSGEEDGLMGSKDLAEKLTQSKTNISLMVNMDMIGRLDSIHNLTVSGIGTSPVLGNIVDRYKPAGFGITIDSSGIGPTDHTSFYLKNIPVLNFFTGTHTDYHKPSDDADRVNYSGMTKIVDYMFQCVQAVALAPDIPFTKTKTNAGKTAPKYKVTLGIMPDYTDHGDGLHIDGVMDDRPAYKAGLQAGDIIVSIGDCPVKEVYSYMECLAKISSGQELPIVFIRKGQRMEAKVVF
jgi:Tol biopolymer transport system component